MQTPKKEEKQTTTIYQKVNHIADWFIRLVVINVFVIIMMLPIVTFYAAISAGHRMFIDHIRKDEPKLISGYFGYFKDQLGKKIWIGVILIFVIAFGFMNVNYYIEALNEEINWFFSIGYYVTFAILVSIYAITLYSFIVIQVFPTVKLRMLFKVSFYLAGKYFWLTILAMMVWSLPALIFLSLTWVIIPALFLFFIFFGISTPIWLYTYITRKPLAYVESLGDTHDEAGD